MLPLRAAVVVVASGRTRPDPLAIVPTIAWLLTAIVVAPTAAAPAVVKACRPTLITHPAARGSPRAVIGTVPAPPPRGTVGGGGGTPARSSRGPGPVRQEP